MWNECLSRVSVFDFATVIRELPISAPWSLLAKHRLLIIAIYAFNIVAVVLNNEISSSREEEAAAPERSHHGGRGTTRGERREQTGPMCVRSTVENNVHRRRR